MRATGQKDYTPLVRGLITEASPLTFPEGATSSELNFVVDREGMVRRRRLGFAPASPEIDTGLRSFQIENVEYWRGPSIIVMTSVDDSPRTSLRFHAADEDFTFLFDLVIAAEKVKTQMCQTTDLLYLTLDNDTKPILCNYNSVEETIEVSRVNIHVRDFELVDDNLSASQRPGTLSDNHKYNLFNAGWYSFKKNSENNNVKQQVHSIFKNSSGSWPSNADVVSVGLIIDENGENVFNPEYVEEASLGNSLAARGHYVYDISDFDRTQRIFAYNVDGAPANTLDPVGTASLSGVPVYDPDDPDDGGSLPGGGDPDVPDDIFGPPGTEIP